MTFEKQVEKAKEQKLENRIRRDVLFIFLGLIFLSFSILKAIKDNNKNDDNKKVKITATKK